MSDMKVGRPKLGEDREPLTYVGFKADAQTVEALSRLTRDAEATPGVVSPKSAAIRRAIIEAAERLEVRKASTRKK